jgi:hypothetical protein
MITDDAEAQALMLEYDVLDQMSHRAYPDDTISSCVVEHHPTHWLLSVLGQSRSSGERLCDRRIPETVGRSFHSPAEAA